MAKILDITEQLNFEDNPQIKIKDVTIEVDSSASTMLKIMQIIGDGNDPTPSSLIEMYQLIFSEESRKKIEQLKLSSKDLTVLIETAMSIVLGETSGE